VLSSFASSPHGFIVKDINVQPAAGAATTSTGAGGGFDPSAPPPAYAPTPGPAGRGGLQTVLNEQLLSITLDVDIVKLLPGI
jgi:hypothetical protein